MEKKDKEIGIFEYVICENPALDQSQPGPTAGTKVLPGSVLTNVEFVRLYI